MATKKDLNDYITTVKSLKPSAEVKFRTQNATGEVTETVASREYVAKHASKEVDVVSKVKGLTERLNKVTEKAAPKPVKEEDLDDIAQEVEDEETLSENAEVTFRNAREPADQDDSPLTYAPNASTAPKSTEEMSETAMLIKLISKLIDKIDDMQNFNPVIHVPAPVIHVTLPETRRTVTKAVERDEEGFIKTVREHVEESPAGEPLIEIKQDRPRRKKKDSE